ncbi:GNAT family N-acetyltransferase [Paenibacillus radicis (ex Xue et al. 2023)]|uniref:GNAT family N-acetyltransferase n=1 Tax=Paenibacillus radicis (ex Xue et al. 2023) TaxID=2972489 RepID=A0ABT1YCJ1_9BACL|nr:GNAT family N-acetyltransferase [Paenibacillus radicis (ex Xue et al. 2023)]MCR8630485.1 GNAT family N-acetyltransferase [Paenibacillus radicis (ex Xue et al. 2023)]
MELYTQRLVLKVIDESAADAVLDFILRNKEFLKEWEAHKKIDHYTYQVQKELLLEENRKLVHGELFKVWIYKIEDRSRIIGSIALNNIVRGAFQACHLGYRIDKDEQNKGYMTEALQEIIKHAFTQLKLHRIEANILPRNKASLKVTEHLGFYNEGLAIKYLKINNKWEDHIHMVLRNIEME